jgi:hypothetical protein
MSYLQTDIFSRLALVGGTLDLREVAAVAAP